MNNRMYETLAKYMERYELIATITTINITTQIMNYRNKHKLTTVEFAKKFELSKKQVKRWESAKHDFTIREICFLFDRGIIDKQVFTACSIGNIKP